MITSDGLDIPSLLAIIAEIGAAQRAAIDPNLDTDPDSPLGQLNGILGERERQLWEVTQVAFDGMNPDACEGFLLDALCALTGTKRAAATYGTVKVNLNIDANKTINAGTTFANSVDPSIQFTLDADVTSTTAGVYADNPATCTALGRVLCNAGTLTIIQTPVAGLNSVTNVRDAIPGQERDTDPELRIRRVNELAAEGASTVDSIRASILRIRNDDDSQPVLDCIVIENTSDYPSATGQPAHSVEAILWDGPTMLAANNALAQAIWDNKAGGILAFGSSFGTAVDAAGRTQIVYFTRANQLNMKLAITLETNAANPSEYAGDNAIKTALYNEFVARALLGVTEIRPMNYAKAAQASGLGVLDVTNLQIGNVLIGPFPPNLQNFPVPARTKALLDTSNITITRVEVTL